MNLKNLIYLLLIHPLIGDESFNRAVLDNISEGKQYCQLDGQIKDSRCDFQTVETINNKLSVPLRNLCSTSFFSHYKVNLNKQCPFWTEHHLCNEPGCEVMKCPKANLPSAWINEGLGAVETTSSISSGGFKGSGMSGASMFGSKPRSVFTEKDYCILEDEDDEEGVFVNLLDNPERYTGYAGASAARVWSAVYEENTYEFLDTLSETELAQTDIEGTFPEVKQVLKRFSTTNNTLSASYLDQLPAEKRVFYRLISGLHASISTHICYKKLDKKTNTWGPDLDCFIQRIGSHPDRLENMYFNYVLLLKSVTKMAKFLKGYSYCEADPEENKLIQQVMAKVIQVSKSCPPTFEENELFKGEDAQRLKVQFKYHFRNISRIMDCVGCEKCRLWGKIQTSGLGTALKVLFEYETKTLNPVRNPHLFQKTEIVSLINAFARISESIQAVEAFRGMYHDRVKAEQKPTPSISSKPEVEKSVPTTASASTTKATSKPKFDFTEVQLSIQSMITNVSLIVYRQTVDLVQAPKKLITNHLASNNVAKKATNQIAKVYKDIAKFFLKK